MIGYKLYCDYYSLLDNGEYLIIIFTGKNIFSEYVYASTGGIAPPPSVKHNDSRETSEAETLEEVGRLLTSGNTQHWFKQSK